MAATAAAARTIPLARRTIAGYRLRTWLQARRAAACSLPFDGLRAEGRSPEDHLAPMAAGLGVMPP